ncbi:hypothetical protein [Peredibacter starrii]|uniref:Uncharacterized protein n=1 Tax=Peredibacter starrii TaxID=28202 RepID=A0AAX4HPE8_9BACT|nr:hypothetical protein [Peredibacter starrii]WPU65040.1 hypothetical protein SOO65_20295 [Peredibacter starrii]
MSGSSIDSLKIKAKLLQKAKKKQGKEIALKDAYAIIAKTAGYPSWKEMKDEYEAADVLNPPKWSAQWKTWFANKEEALKHLTPDSYLIPYRKECFICDANYISALGILPDDPDLSRVGHDWTSPQDSLAWTRLVTKIKNRGKL